MADGDTIWRDDIAADLLKLRPDVVVLNAGYAHVIGFGPIIMGKEDLLNVHFTLPEAKIMAIHLEAVNHCLVSREEMRQYALDNQIADVVSIPQDGKPWFINMRKGERTMKLTDVAIVAVEGFSPFHYAVPACCLAIRFRKSNALICTFAPSGRGCCAPAMVLRCTPPAISPRWNRRISWWCLTGARSIGVRRRRCLIAWCGPG